MSKPCTCFTACTILRKYMLSSLRITGVNKFDKKQQLGCQVLPSIGQMFDDICCRDTFLMDVFRRTVTC